MILLSLRLSTTITKIIIVNTNVQTYIHIQEVLSIREKNFLIATHTQSHTVIIMKQNVDQ